MANIDQVIARMVQGKAERAILINDQPMHFCTGSMDTPGPAISLAQLQSVTQEVTPPDLRPQLSHDGAFHFPYKSPHGTFEIGIARHNGILQLSIAPAADAALAKEHDTTSAAGAPPAAAPSSAAPTTTPSSTPPGAANAGPSPTPWLAAEGEKGTRKIKHIDELFHLMMEIEASDLHLSSKVTPMMRIHGIMHTLEAYVVNDPDELQKTLFAITPPRNREQWEDDKDTDFSYDLQGLARFRCNLFSDRHGIGGVFRLIPSQVWTVEEMGLPKVMTDFCLMSKGLVVVTGPTGSGKSTTLAALIDYINKHREDHIVTVEDPVEFVHENIKCLINQREVHVNTQGFAQALRASLREDPDIILVGEMRDLETTKKAIEAAETGHLVFGTLHTSSAPSTVDRIIDQFPPEEQAQIRVMLSETLKGVVAQTLLRTKDGKRVAAFEILLVPTSVSNLIREGKTFQLPSQMQIGKAQGMVTMHDSILDFVKSGRVDPMEGYIKATDKVSLLGAYEANGIPSPLEEQPAIGGLSGKTR